MLVMLPSFPNKVWPVLILVLLEDGLLDVGGYHNKTSPLSLNPCFAGRWVAGGLSFANGYFFMS